MKLKLVNKTRFYTFVAVVVMTIAFVRVIAVANNTPSIVGYDTYVVTSSDTLWDVAKTSNGYDNIDIRRIVYDIEQASDINASVNVGDVVQVPVYEMKGDR